jgi:hypothetical protein
LQSEIAQARNIQCVETRKSVIRGLQKLLVGVQGRREAVAFYTDGDELIEEKYGGVRRLYHCGREYQKYEPETFDQILLVVIDSKEAAVGTTNGERVNVLWTDTSLVQNKHDMGGQSKNRFQRAREEALKHWLRKVVEIVIGYQENRNIIVGGPGMVKEAFIKELPS